MGRNNYNIDDVYPKQPLIEVSCEIRFPLMLVIQDKSFLMQEALGDKYPNISVSRKKNALLDVHTLQSSDKMAGISFSGDRFSFFEKNYKGHQGFIKTFLETVRIFNKQYKVNNISRLSWRYINLIPFVRDNKGLIPLGKFLDVSLNLPGNLANVPENISLLFNIPLENGEILTKIENVLAADGKEAILLDHDFSINNFAFVKLETNTINAHKTARDLFEKYITDVYRSYIKGEEAI
ncbi:MAG: TIGR04255 family protein [Candidatus Margulisbacteria bacterium]|jgi:uncharacterized protein (TIGR04255 family)|nr:TIGR04255 family protein [Candidatus Margulisiibacteriota bacterium]